MALLGFVFKPGLLSELLLAGLLDQLEVLTTA